MKGARVRRDGIAGGTRMRQRPGRCAGPLGPPQRRRRCRPRLRCEQVALGFGRLPRRQCLAGDRGVQSRRGSLLVRPLLLDVGVSARPISPFLFRAPFGLPAKSRKYPEIKRLLRSWRWAPLLTVAEVSCGGRPPRLLRFILRTCTVLLPFLVRFSQLGSVWFVRREGQRVVS